MYGSEDVISNRVAGFYTYDHTHKPPKNGGSCGCTGGTIETNVTNVATINLVVVSPGCPITLCHVLKYCCLAAIVWSVSASCFDRVTHSFKKKNNLAWIFLTFTLYNMIVCITEVPNE